MQASFDKNGYILVRGLFDQEVNKYNNAQKEFLLWSGPLVTVCFKDLTEIQYTNALDFGKLL